MSTHDPYSPPKSELSEPRLMGGKMLHDTFAALVLLHLFGTLRDGWSNFELVTTGTMHPLGFLLTLVAGVCLYLGTILMRFKGSSKVHFFLLAAMGFAITLPVWRWPAYWSPPGLLGMLLGAAGYWLARRRATGLDLLSTEGDDAKPVQTLSRPIGVVIVFLLSFSPVVFIALFLWQNWSRLNGEMPGHQWNIATMFLPPLLFLCGGFLLLFLRKEAIILFTLYLAFNLGRVMLDFGNFMSWLDLLLVVGVITYSIQLFMNRVLR